MILALILCLVLWGIIIIMALKAPYVLVIIVLGIFGFIVHEILIEKY
jgi:hypothetical protein